MTKPLKILMMLQMSWERDFGGSRVQLEIAEELTKLGHVIEKFDIKDAFPKAENSLWETLTRPHFSVKAREFVRQNGHRFDIIDAHQGNLPFNKDDLGFKGLLVTRSVGLYPLYYQWDQEDRAKHLPKNPKSWLVDRLLAWRNQEELKHCYRSFYTCDLLNLPNEDELSYVRDRFNLGNKSFVFPFGLSSDRFSQLQAIKKPNQVRLSNPQIVFIGTWGARKGARDWREIITRVKSRCPQVSFLFLGTGLSEATVLGELKQTPQDWLKIVPRYRSEELPELLSGATVGAFPSYLEGFGFAVLEQLAAGIPTISYDVSGPRAMLRHLPDWWRVIPGDRHQFSEGLLQVLEANLDTYQVWQNQCFNVAQMFSWSKIAQDTLAIYTHYLTKINDDLSSN